MSAASEVAGGALSPASGTGAGAVVRLAPGVAANKVSGAGSVAEILQHTYSVALALKGAEAGAFSAIGQGFAHEPMAEPCCQQTAAARTGCAKKAAITARATSLAVGAIVVTQSLDAQL